MDTSSWLDHFNPREQQYQSAGIPGHNQFVIIAKLAALLDARASIAVHYAIERTLEATQ